MVARDPSSEGPSVRLIRGAAVALGRNPRKAFVSGLALITALWVAGGLYTVNTDETAAVRRFGRLVRSDIGPGLGFGLPRGIDRVSRAKTEQISRMEVIGDELAVLSLLTGDENVITIGSVVQYKVSDPGKYLFAVEEPEPLVHQAVRVGLVEVVSKMPVDRVLTAGKAEIERAARERAQSVLREYGAGITLVSLSLQSVDPPLEAAEAFRRVSDARAEAARLINDAESRRARTASLARGEASSISAEARADATTRMAAAEGAAERFTRVLVQKRRMPDQTRTELYLEMVRTVLPRARVVLLAPGQKPKVEVNLAESATREVPEDEREPEQGGQWWKIEPE